MWKNIPLKGAVYVSLGITLVTIIVILITKDFLPPVAPLFYGLPAGNNQLVPTLFLLVAPFSSLAIILLNIVIAARVTDSFYKNALIISAMFVSVLYSITIVRIIMLIGFF